MTSCPLGSWLSHLPRAQSSCQPTNICCDSFSSGKCLDEIGEKCIKRYDTCVVEGWKAKGDCQPLRLTESGGCVAAAAWETH